MFDRGFNAVSFDAGNTLLYCDPPPPVIYARALGRHGREVKADDVAPVFSEAWAEMQRRSTAGRDRYSSLGGDDRAWWGAFLREVLDRLQHDAPWQALLDDLYATFSRPDVWKLFPDTLPTLDGLSTGNIPSILISNWDKRLPEILRQLDLERRFEVVAVSSIEGFEKPSHEIFRRSAERLGVRPHGILHVGDSPREDYQGAADAGFASVLIDRRGIFADDGYRRIASLEEVIDIVSGP